MEIKCVLGDKTASKIVRHMASGRYGSPEEVVGAALEALDTFAAETEELRRLIAEADADVAAGRLYDVSSADELLALVKNPGDPQ